MKEDELQVSTSPECFYFILGGHEDKKIINEIVNSAGNQNAMSLADKNIIEISHGL